jgi:tRNA-specific 2-thiouridylase
MRILVGLSGGVDSAVAAYLLKQQWHDVVGGFMKNYVSETGNCTTYEDAEEAIKVADFLWIELLAFDLQKEYQERIIDYIFEWYKRGVTPNPDVLCNSLIKFDVFLEKALAQWFDKIAMGHYATINKVQWTNNNSDVYHLVRGVDYNKDQTYFLAWLNQFQLSKSIFPLGVLKKEEVRTIAREIGLPNAARKDSQGLCFIGNVPIKTFLMQRFPKKTGDIKTLDGKTVWRHDGAYFFTIGQKQGLGLNFKAYVYRIDVENNVVYVWDKDIEELQTKQIIVKDWHRIAEEYPIWSQLLGKIRYRQNPLAHSTIIDVQATQITVEFDTPQRAVAPGQVFVLYDGELCVWSGIIG